MQRGRELHSIDEALRQQRALVIGAGALDLLARAHLRHRHVPPMAAEFGGDVRNGLDDENGGAVVCFGGGKRALELGNRGDVPRNGPETFGMSREVNFTAVGDTVACGRCNRYRRRLFRASLRLRGESRSEGITVSRWVARTRHHGGSSDE